MAEDIQHFTVTCPPGTAKANPQFTSLTLPPRIVRQIDWRVPKGAMGVMGFLLAMGKVPVLPTSTFAYVVANGENNSWNPTNYPDSGAWQCVMYNTGANAHSVYLTFHMDLPQPPAELQTLIPAFQLMPVTDLSKAGPPIGARP